MDEKELFTILIVDDEEDVRKSLQRLFARTHYRLFFAATGEEALATLAKHSVDIMLLDLKMPGMNGMTVMREALATWPVLKVIILTGHGGVREAVSSIKLGATDFFEKSAPTEMLSLKIDQLHKLWQLENENRGLRAQLNMQFTFAGLIGESAAMLKLKDMIVRIAFTDTSVLIQGESGTGKELVAKSIHHHSNRKSGVYIPVDCASLNETVIESELFGHNKGAFTGAEQTTLGLIRAADKGTLFLDEIGELPLKMQAKLLRTIQEREVRPVGSTKRYPVDIRIVAASNRDLKRAAEDGSFRLDLYYRLSPVTLTIPPLRERIEDIPMLCQHFCKKAAADEGLLLKNIADSAYKVLKQNRWNGNVRELENVLKTAMTFSREDTIQPADFLLNMESCPEPMDETMRDQNSFAEYEKEIIRQALRQTSGSRREAATQLSISEATLYRRIKKYNL